LLLLAVREPGLMSSDPLTLLLQESGSSLHVHPIEPRTVSGDTPSHSARTRPTLWGRRAEHRMRDDPGISSSRNASRLLRSSSVVPFVYLVKSPRIRDSVARWKAWADWFRNSPRWRFGLYSIGEEIEDCNTGQTKSHCVTNRLSKNPCAVSRPLGASCFSRHAGPIRSEPTSPEPAPWWCTTPKCCRGR